MRAEKKQQIINRIRESGFLIDKTIYNSLMNKIKKGEAEKLIELSKTGPTYYKVTLDNQDYFCLYLNGKKKQYISKLEPRNRFALIDGKWTRLNTNYKQMTHTIQRAMERFAIAITPEDYLEMSEMIKEGEAEFLFEPKSQYEKIVFYRITYEDQEYTALYSHQKECIITFYRNNWVVKDENGNYGYKKDVKKKKKFLKTQKPKNKKRSPRTKVYKKEKYKPEWEYSL